MFIGYWLLVKRLEGYAVKGLKCQCCQLPVAYCLLPVACYLLPFYWGTSCTTKKISIIHSQFLNTTSRTNGPKSASIFLRICDLCPKSSNLRAAFCTRT